MNIIKVLWCRFEQCLGTFAILLVKGFSQTGLFRHLSDYVFKIRPVLNIDWLGSDQGIWQRCCEADFSSALARLPSCLLKGPLKWDILDIYLTTFYDSVISEIQNLWGSFFFSKNLRFNIHFKNAVKNWGKVFFLR